MAPECIADPFLIISIITHLPEEMKGQFFCFLSILQLMSLVCITTSRPFQPNHGHAVYQGKDRGPLSLQIILSLDKGNKSRLVAKIMDEESEYKGVNKIGSNPPSCEHKCYGCMPCEAIQVPTTGSRVGVQYANYEPEGWKCKCGPAFYSP